MSSLSIADVDTVDRIGAFYLGTVQRDKSGKMIVQSLSKFSRMSEKSVEIAVYDNLGGISANLLSTFSVRTNPVLTFLWTKGCTMQSLTAFARTVLKCIVNRQTFFFMYIDLMKMILSDTSIHFLLRLDEDIFSLPVFIKRIFPP